MLTIGLLCVAYVTWFWLSNASAQTPGDTHNYILAAQRLNAGHPFPLALIGVKSRGWWAIAAVFAAASLALLPQSLDWLSVVRNGQGVRSGLLYSLQDLPLLAVPLFAWAG
jgi:hypothetical protein